VRRVTVSIHAVEQARARQGRTGSNAEVTAWIIEQVNDALDSKPERVLRQKAKSFRLYGESKRPLLGTQRFVFDRDAEHGWIIDRTEQETTVITSIVRSGLKPRKQREGQVIV
jgi:hypothetical protein